MYEIVQLELVDLAGIKTRETIAHALEECSQLCLVICRDPLPGDATLGLVGSPVDAICRQRRYNRQLNPSGV